MAETDDPNGSQERSPGRGPTVSRRSTLQGGAAAAVRSGRLNGYKVELAVRMVAEALTAAAGRTA